MAVGLRRRKSGPYDRPHSHRHLKKTLADPPWLRATVHRMRRSVVVRLREEPERCLCHGGAAGFRRRLDVVSYRCRLETGGQLSRGSAG